MSIPLSRGMIHHGEVESGLLFFFPTVLPVLLDCVKIADLFLS